MADDTRDQVDTDPVPIHRKDRRARRVPAGPPSAQPTVVADEEAQESRAERIARIRKLIQEGNYHPDPYEVARAMMEHGGLT